MTMGKFFSLQQQDITHVYKTSNLKEISGPFIIIIVNQRTKNTSYEAIYIGMPYTWYDSISNFYLKFCEITKFDVLFFYVWWKQTAMAHQAVSSSSDVQLISTFKFEGQSGKWDETTRVSWLSLMQISQHNV